MSYISSHKKQLLDTLENQVLFGDLTSVLIAEKGMGKSYFLQQLCNRLEQQVYISQIQAGTTLSIEQLDKSICLQLGLSWQGSELNLLEKIKQSVTQKILLTIDDAHLLTADCLNYLLAIAHDDEPETESQVYLLLTGESKLANTLSQTEKLKQNPSLCVVLELQAVEPEEIKFLIADFESIKVSKAQKRFDQQKLDYFWQLSQGSIGELKKQLARWQLETETLAAKIKPNKESVNQPKEPMVDHDIVVSHQNHPSNLPDNSVQQAKANNYWLILGYCGIAFLLILALIYQDEINQQITPNKDTGQVIEPLAIDESKKLQNDFSQHKTSESEEKLEFTQPKELVLNLADKNKNINPIINNNSQTDLERSDELDLKKSTQVLGNTNQIGKLNKPSKTQENNEIVQSAEAESQKAITQDSLSKAKPIKTQKTIAEPKLKNTTESTPETIAFRLSADELTLTQQKPEQFTLQWVAVSTKQSAQDFIASHPLKNIMTIYRRKQGEGYLYLVVAGQYNSRVDADNARAAYILRGYDGKPWIKTYKAIISEIKQLNPAG